MATQERAGNGLGSIIGDYSIDVDNPSIVIFDDSSLGEQLCEEMEEMSWHFSVVEEKEEVLSRVGCESVECVVVDPTLPSDLLDLLGSIQSESDIPIVVWGNDISLHNIRKVAQAYGMEYVPKPVDDSERVYCVSSLSLRDPMSSYCESQDGLSEHCDDLVISIIRHTVRNHRMADQIQTQLDAIENSLHGVAILDANHEFMYVNETMVDVFGFSNSDAFLGNSWQMCYPQDEIEHLTNDVFPQVVETGNWLGEVEARRVDGTVFPTRLAVASLDGGGLVFMVEDISDRKRMREQLDEVYERVDESFIALNTSGEVVHINERALEVLDITYDQALNSGIFDLISCAKDGQIRERFETAVETQEPVVFTNKVDPISIWLEIRIYPSESGVSIYFRDVTDRKEQDRKVELFSSFVEESRDGFFVIRADTAKLDDVNSAGLEWFGLDSDELVGGCVVDYVNEYVDLDDEFTHDDFDRIVDEACSEGTVVREVDVEFSEQNKVPLEVEFSYTSMNDEEYILAVAHDVSDRRTAEEKVREDRDRFKSIVDSAPDPILVIDDSSSEVIETNSAAVELFGYSRSEILGSTIAEFFTEGAMSDGLEQFCDTIHSGGGRFRYLNDGTYVKAQCADGGVVPVEVSCSSLELVGGDVTQLVLSSIDDEIRHEKELKAINEASKGLFHKNSSREIVNMAIEGVEGLPTFVGAGIYLYNDDSGVLEPAASTESISSLFGVLPVIEPGSGVFWDAYSSGEPQIFKEISKVNLPESVSATQSEIAIPIGSHGLLFVCTSEDVGDCDVALELAEIFASNLESALDRVETVLELREREREANLQKQRLEYVSELNKQIRSLNKALVQAESKESIRGAICDRLIQLEGFDGVWIGEIDIGNNEISPKCVSNVPSDFLEELPLTKSSDYDTSLTVKAAMEGEVFTCSNMAANAQEKYWANLALEYEYKSSISVPLEHEGISHGVLTIYSEHSEAFDEKTRSVLDELGSLVAYGFQSVSSRNALVSEGGVELSFQLPDLDGPCAKLAEDLGAEMTVHNMVPANADEESYLIHCHIDGASSDGVKESIDCRPSFGDFRIIGDDETGIYEISIVEQCAVTQLANFGANLQTAMVSPERCHFAMTVPSERDKKAFVSRVQEQFPGASLSATQEMSEEDSIPWSRILRSSLTKKQEDTLRTAYKVGYFDTPAKTNGRELADSLGYAQTTISKRIRAAQRNLFGTLWDMPVEEVDG